MRRTIVTLATLSLFALPGLAGAQSLQQRCDAKKAELDALRAQVTQMDTDLTAKADKIEKVRRRLQMLEAERAKVQAARQAAANRIKVDEAQRERMCKPLERCGRLDQRVTDLQNRVNPLYAQLRAIRDEIRRETQQIAGLNNDVSRIQNQYGQLKCEDLEPGKTAQATIDRCHALFSEWNAAVARINQLEGSIRALRGRYQGAINQLQALNREIARLRKEMSRECSGSQQYAALEAMDRERSEYEGMQTELDDADKRVNQLKLLKIAPGKKRPQLKKAP